MTINVSMRSFHATATISSGPQAALVTLSVVAGAVSHTEVRCAGKRADGRICNRKVMVIPGHAVVEVRVSTTSQGSGRGRVVDCPRCNSLLEIVEHR